MSGYRAVAAVIAIVLSTSAFVRGSAGARGAVREDGASTPPPRLIVTPDEATVSPLDTVGLSYTFYAKQPSGRVAGLYDVTCAVTGVVVSCTPSESQVWVFEEPEPYAGLAVVVNYTTSAVGTGTLTVTFTKVECAPTCGSSDDGSINVRVGTLQVTPDGAQRTVTNYSDADTASFTVTNPTALTLSYTMSCSTTGSLTCTGVAPGLLSVGPSGSGTVTATFDAGAPGSATLTVTASVSGVSDSGSYAVSSEAPTYGFKVTPKMTSQSAVAPSTGNIAVFTVQNTGASSQRPTYWVTCSAPLTSCSTPGLGPNLSPGATAQDTVAYGMQNSTGTGTMKLVAGIYDVELDSATNAVTAVANPYEVSVAQNFGDRQDRTGCVTGGAGPGAAFYCGELLVMQPMVGYRSMNKGRAPTLIYSSRAATGASEVLVDVTMPGGGAQLPLTLEAKLSLDGVLRRDVTYSMSGWQGGTTRRLVLPVPAALATGVHDGYVETVRHYHGGVDSSTSVSVSAVVVNRDSSAFGRGWWMAGVERAYLNGAGNALAFVEAEASAVVFRWNGSQWVAPAGETSTLTTETYYVPGLGNRSVYKRTLKNQTVLRYDQGSGQLLLATEPVSTQAQYHWTGAGPDGLRLDSITDEAAQRIRLSYGGYGGRLSSVSVPGASATQVFIGASTRVDSLADPDGGKTRFTYDGYSRMTGRTGRRTGETSSYAYASAVDVLGILDSTSTAVTPDGTLRHRAYQLEGMPTASSGNTPGYPSNALVTIRDYRGVATRINVDRLGRPTRIAAPDSGIVSITRDSATSLPKLMEWSPMGRRVSFTWDYTWGDLLSTTDSTDNNATTSYQYHSTFHTVTRVIAPMGDSTLYRYGSTGLLDTIIAPGGDRTRFVYNGSGQVLKVWEPGLDSATEYSYNGSTGNLSWTQTPQGHVSGAITQYFYDGSGTRVDSVRSPGYVTTTTHYSFDALNRVRQVDTYGTGLNRRVKIDYLNGERALQYTLPSSSQLEGRHVTDSLDAMGRVVRNCTPVMGSACHWYGYGQGLLSSMSVAQNGSTALNFRTWSYDLAGRMQRFEYTAPSQMQLSGKAAYGDANEFRYNQLGQITYAENGRAVTHRSYYPNRRLACEHQLIKRWGALDTTSASQFVIRYYYDLNGRLIRKAFGAGSYYSTLDLWPGACTFAFQTDSATVRYTYDSRGRVDSLVGGNLASGVTAAFTVHYDAASRRDTLRNTRTPWRESWTFDQDGQPTGHVWDDGGGLNPQRYAVSDAFTSRDGVGRLLHRNGLDGSFNYTYDGLGQLATAPDETFSYDSYGAGERPLATHGSRTDTLTYDNASGRVTWARLGVVGGSPLLHAYRYNAAGDRLADSLYSPSSKARATLTSVDGAGRVVAMQSVPGGLNYTDTLHLWTYWYDALGRRVVAADSMATLARPVERLFYDGAMVVLRGEDYWQQQGGVDVNPVRLHRNATEAYLNDVGLDKPLYSATTLLGIGCGTTASQEYQYHADERGSVRAVTYGTGYYCNAGYGYEGFGGGSTVPTNARPGYTGAPSDASGLTFLRNRFYDPNTGTFTQPDPIGLLGGINLYGYVGNNPVAYTDPFGLCPPVDDDPCNTSTGDPNLDNMRTRQPLESAVKSSPADAWNPGYSREVGGWCTGAGSCSRRVGDVYKVNIGPPRAGSQLAYHSHPNEGRPLPGRDAELAAQGQEHRAFRGLSPEDRQNAASRPVPTYILAPNTIIRLTPNGSGGVDETTFPRWTTPQ